MRKCVQAGMIGFGFTIDCKQSLFCSKICGEEHKEERNTSEQSWACELEMRSCEAAGKSGLGRQAKRETTMVSYSISEAWHSGDRVILLLGLQSHDAHPSVTFISDMEHMPNSVVT